MKSRVDTHAAVAAAAAEVAAEEVAAEEVAAAAVEAEAEAAAEAAEAAAALARLPPPSLLWGRSSISEHVLGLVLSIKEEEAQAAWRRYLRATGHGRCGGFCTGCSGR